MKKTFNITSLTVLAHLGKQHNQSKYIEDLVMNDMRGHKNVISRDEVIQLINEYAGISKSSNDDVIINSAKDLLKL